MKKLMIAACAVAFSAATQAASYNWTWSTSDAATTPFSAATPSGKSDGTIYLMTGFTGASASDAAAAVNASKTALLTALRTTGGTDFDTVVKSATGYGDSKTLSNGGLAETPYIEDVGGKQYAYAVILDLDDDGNTWAYISAMKNSTGVIIDTEHTGSGTLQFAVSKTDMYDLKNSATGTSAGWYRITGGTTPIPEPTSGLLLLLGVAGLALRRKQK